MEQFTVFCCRGFNCQHFQEEAGRLESCGFSKHRLLVHHIYKSQVTASLYCSKHDVTSICCWAPCTGAYAAEHRLLQHGARIDRYRLPAWRSAANPPAAVAAVNQWNGRTDAWPLHKPCCAYYAGSTRDPARVGSITTLAWSLPEVEWPQGPSVLLLHSSDLHSIFGNESGNPVTNLTYLSLYNARCEYNSSMKMYQLLIYSLID